MKSMVDELENALPNPGHAMKKREPLVVEDYEEERGLRVYASIEAQPVLDVLKNEIHAPRVLVKVVVSDSVTRLLQSTDSVAELTSVGSMSAAREPSVHVDMGGTMLSRAGWKELVKVVEGAFAQFEEKFPRRP